MVIQKNQDLLEPSMQDAYWSSIDPDIRSFFDDFESREDWTYSYNEIPELFNKISKILPKFAKYKINSGITEEMEPLIRKLIIVLSAMPMRHAVSAVSWLDNNIEDETDIGWGVAIYMSASQIATTNPNDPIFAESKILHDRIDLMLQSKLSTLLFIKLRDIG